MSLSMMVSVPDDRMSITVGADRGERTRTAEAGLASAQVEEQDHAKSANVRTDASPFDGK